MKNLKTLGALDQEPQGSLLSPNDTLVYEIKKHIQFYIPHVLNNNDVNKAIHIALAVSGGVDSQVMLHAMHKLACASNIHLSVISINHNIRGEDESRNDVQLVENYCKDVLKINCTIVTLEKGYIKALSNDRQRGIEDAARHERYLQIQRYAVEQMVDYVFFAHNRDDQLETLVQHFLQGSCAGISGTASAGILQYTKYPIQDINKNDNTLMLFRPLLSISRTIIEEYAEKNNIPFCIDSTNEDCLYYRNRIRHRLIPVLYENFIGWDTGVLNGAEKAYEEHLFIDSCTKELKWELGNDVRIEKEKFFNLGYPVRVRLLYKGFSIAGIQGRIPYKLVQSCAKGQKRVQGAGIEIFQNKEYIIIRKAFQKAEDTYREAFNDIVITECGEYKTNTGTFLVQVQKPQKLADTEIGEFYIGEFSLPILIRKKNEGDKIKTADGKHKTIKKIFSQWRVTIEDRHRIPVFEHNGQLQCIFAQLYGYPNWYVKRSENNSDETVAIYFKRNNYE